MRLILPTVFTFLATAPTMAQDINISVEVPRQRVLGYHAPYIGMWLETPDGVAAANLAVWYDHAKWLRDIRQWWRRVGRGANISIDGVSGPTRPPGTYSLPIGADVLADLPPGQYDFVIEAAREGGGRELLRTTIVWPPEKTQTIRLTGERELGDITLAMTR